MPRHLMGAYGFRLRGIDSPLLVHGERSWPTLQVVKRIGTVDYEREAVSEDRAELLLRTGGGVVVERQPACATYTTSAPLTDDELVHPYLAPGAAIAAHWLGRECIHAGGVAVGGGVWGVIGGREAGKSSLLAWLAHEGFPIACDDLLVTDGTTVFPGPRSLDLRRDAAEQLGAGTALGVVGARERWRVVLAEVLPRLALSGWLLLAWAEEVSIRRVSAAECLQTVAASRSVRLPPRDPGLLLRLAALPAWELRRPRSWASLPASVEAIRGELQRSGARARQPGGA